MADEKKISGLTEASDASASDEFVVVNKDVTTGQDASASGQTSKITLDNLRNAILGGSSGSTGNDVVFDGNVGIGTSNLLDKLTVAGSIKAWATGGNANFLGSRQDGLTTIKLNTEGDSFLTGGNVGIGTDSPNEHLHIEGDVPTLQLSENQATGGVAHINFCNENTIRSAVSSNLGNQELQFYTGSDTSTPKMLIKNTGNIGIGTDDPKRKLHISGAATIVMTDEFQESGNPETRAPNRAIVNNAGLFQLGAYNDDFSSYDSHMVINHIGNVGIGTPSPDAELDVIGEISSGHNIDSNSEYKCFSIRSSRPADDYGGLGKDYWTMKLKTLGPTTGVSGDWTEGSDHRVGNLVFQRTKDYLSSDMVDTMTLSHDGNVGIGTLNPTNKLEVICPENIPFVGIFRDFNINAPENEGGAGTGIRLGAKANALDADGASVDDSEYNQVGALLAGGLYPANPEHTPASVTNKGHMYMQTLGLDGDMHTRMYINHNGNVGIGDDIQLPRATLHVQSKDSLIAHFGRDGAGHGADVRSWIAIQAGYEASVQNYESTVRIGAQRWGNTNSAHMVFQTYDGVPAGTFEDRMIISAVGHVGIGTNLPGSLLHVNRPSTTDGDYMARFTSDSTSPNDNGIYIKTNGNTSGGGYSIRCQRGTTDAFYVKEGDLNAYFGGNLTVANRLFANGVEVSGLDANNLENVRATEATGLESINNLVVSDFEKDGVTKVGIVAQDMQKVLPQSVSGGDEYEAVVAEAEGDVIRGLGTDDEHIYSTDIKKSDFEDPKHSWDDGAEFVETKAEETETRNHSLATSNDELIATLVKAVQELSAKNDELSAKVDELSK